MGIKNYKVEDFMLDAQFKHWVLDPEPESNEFWSKWLQNHPEHKLNFLMAKELILQTEFREFKPSKDASDRVLNAILRKSDIIGGQKKLGKSRTFDWRAGLKIAAVITLIIGIYFLVENQKTENPVIVKETTTIIKQNPEGRKSQIFLPDGSIVWLNAASSLEYSSDFANDKRYLKLSGEAYFDVEDDKTRPFIVESNGLTVTALGTVFNVMAYENNETLEVSLVEGLVKVERIDDGEHSQTILSPNEYLEYDKVNARIKKVSTVDISSKVSWKAGIIHFRGASLNEVISRLEQWYGVKVMVENPEMAGEWVYSSEFDNQSLDNVLRSLGYTKGFTYSIDKNIVTIKF